MRRMRRLNLVVIGHVGEELAGGGHADPLPVPQLVQPALGGGRREEVEGGDGEIKWRDQVEGGGGERRCKVEGGGGAVLPILQTR